MDEAIREWYGVRGVFRWYFKDTGDTYSIEERVLLFQAANFDEALDLAEAEAVCYCEDNAEANFRIEPLRRWRAYWIGEDQIKAGVEIFSCLRKTTLSGEAFVRRYYPKSHDKR